ncbi:MAG: 6-phosphofructokinase [Acidimicrobiales bacterium]|nr:6-phosphofructokinase [Acidimicrobiales bacterium]
MRVAMLTSGGDAPGMNAAIRAATVVALALGHEPVGVRHGYRGLVDGELAPLELADVSDALRRGGTLLQSARCPEFHDAEVRQQARTVLTEHEVDGLIVIGGNGSLTGASYMSDPAEAGEWPVQVMGIPASIDNDIALTSLSIGVDTAMNTIVEACDKIADTASAHDRVFVVEVMGRDCGYLAMTSAIASGADMVLFPEADRSEAELVGAVADSVLAVRKRGGVQKVIAIKAEGIETPSERLKELVDAELAERSGGTAVPIETRVTVLGHVVRGGRPSAFDRLLGSRMGNVAVRALADGAHRQMVAWQPPVDAGDLGVRSEHDPYCHLMPLDVALEATRQLLDGQSPLARWRSTIFDDLQDVFLL